MSVFRVGDEVTIDQNDFPISYDDLVHREGQGPYIVTEVDTYLNHVTINNNSVCVPSILRKVPKMNKLDLKKPTQLKNGTPARLICKNAAEPWPYVFLAGPYSDGSDSLIRTDRNGCYRGVSGSSLDIVNGPAEHERWVSYNTLNHRTVSFGTEEAATQYFNADSAVRSRPVRIAFKMER